MSIPPPAVRRRTVAAMATLVGLGLGPAAGSASVGPASSGETQVVLPTTLDAPEGREATLESDPTGPAAMALTYGTTTEVETSVDPLVLAAADDVYRRVRTAERRKTSSDLGSPAPMMLSTDGRTVAVGSSRDDGTVALVDTSSGEIDEVGLDRVNATLPSAWDPDNGYLWVRARYVYEAQRSGDTVYDDWEWHRIDLSRQRAERLPPLDRALNVAPLHGTGQLLVRHNTGRAQIFSVDDLQPVSDSFDLSGVVEGWASAPDGNRFAVTGTDELRVHDAADPERVVDTVGIPEGSRFQGWVDDSSVLIGWADEGAGRWALEEVDLDSGRRVLVTEQPAVRSGAQIGGVTLATGLLSELDTREPGRSDHGHLWSRLGPWPVLVVGALLGGALILVLRRRRSRPGGDERLG